MPSVAKKDVSWIYTGRDQERSNKKKTYASFEPMLDYCVVKIPRLPFDKFISAKTYTDNTDEKATGEVAVSVIT